MNLRPRRREEPEINLVPMIDVVLVLLIFFMIATSLRRQSELEIRLPEASDRSVPSRVADLNVVDIDAAGRYAVNGRTLETADPATLKAALLQATDGRKLPLTISADARASYQAVVTAMDVAGQLGLNQLNIATVNRPQSAPKPSPAPDVAPTPEP